MNATDTLRGVLAPNLTPFEEDGLIAMDLYVAHARHLLEQGCAGLVPFGTTGEALSVSSDERVEALHALVESGIEPARLLPGVGLTNLPETLRLVESVAALGCRRVLALPPFFFKNVPEDGLIRYFDQLVEATGDIGCDIYLYHIPQVAGVGIPHTVVRRLREAHPDAIAGIKDSSGSWENLETLFAIPGLRVYPGQETYLSDALAQGVPGCITATANLNARAIHEIVRLWDAGKRDRAREAMGDVRAFRTTVEGYAPIPAMKGLLARASGDPRWWNVRPPFLPGEPKMVRSLERELGKRFGFRAAVQG